MRYVFNGACQGTGILTAGLLLLSGSGVLADRPLGAASTAESQNSSSSGNADLTGGSTPSNSAYAAVRNANAPNAIPGQYIVVLKEGADRNDVSRRHALKPHRHYSHALNGFAAA